MSNTSTNVEDISSSSSEEDLDSHIDTEDHWSITSSSEQEDDERQMDVDISGVSAPFYGILYSFFNLLIDYLK